MAIRNDLPDRYRFWDLWLFVSDADRAGTEAMNALERDLAEKEGHSPVVLRGRSRA